jgi:hypothetical protein
LLWFGNLAVELEAESSNRYRPTLDESDGLGHGIRYSSDQRSLVTLLVRGAPGDGREITR